MLEMIDRSASMWRVCVQLSTHLASLVADLASIEEHNDEIRCAIEKDVEHSAFAVRFSLKRPVFRPPPDLSAALKYRKSITERPLNEMKRASFLTVQLLHSFSHPDQFA